VVVSILWQYLVTVSCDSILWQYLVTVSCDKYFAYFRSVLSVFSVRFGSNSVLQFPALCRSVMLSFLQVGWGKVRPCLCCVPNCGCTHLRTVMLCDILNKRNVCCSVHVTSRNAEIALLVLRWPSTGGRLS